MGSGIGAIFRAPLAGAIFAGEILYRDADLESEVIIPGAVASTIAYSIFQLSLPEDLRFTPLFGDTLQHEVSHPTELLPYTVLAFVLVAAAGVYVKTFHFTHHLFKRVPILPHLKPCVGALLAGLLAIGVFYSFDQDTTALASLGSGYGFLQQALDNANSMSLAVLFMVALTKILTTSLTIGSGGSGGVFGPSMVIGGAVGAGVGKFFHHWIPEFVTNPSAFAIVGMAGFFAGCANAPFSTILMVTEMTGDYKLLVPTLWVSSLCFILCRKWSLYSSQVNSRLDSPAHKGDFTIDLLEGILVGDVYRPTKKRKTFHEDVSLDEIVHALADSPQRYFYVNDSAENLVGVFSAEDVRRHLFDDVIWKIANARDVMVENVVTLQLDDDLNYAFGQFTALNVDELPVVAAENRNKVIGVVRRKEAIAAYNNRRLEMQKQMDDENIRQKS
jgi:CIC family chloride channel protein